MADKSKNETEKTETKPEVLVKWAKPLPGMKRTEDWAYGPYLDHNTGRVGVRLGGTFTAPEADFLKLQEQFPGCFVLAKEPSKGARPPKTENRQASPETR